jgi:hypothetical protein
MSRLVRHIVIPSLLPLLFFVVAATPVEVLGCRNRGLLAVAVTLVSALGALGATFAGARCRWHRDPTASWWAVTTLVLLVPVAAFLALA